MKKWQELKNSNLTESILLIHCTSILFYAHDSDYRRHGSQSLNQSVIDSFHLFAISCGFTVWLKTIAFIGQKHEDSKRHKNLYRVHVEITWSQF